jgi:hypothetical protein
MLKKFNFSNLKPLKSPISRKQCKKWCQKRKRREFPIIKFRQYRRNILVIFLVNSKIPVFVFQATHVCLVWKKIYKIYRAYGRHAPHLFVDNFTFILLMRTSHFSLPRQNLINFKLFVANKYFFLITKKAPVSYPFPTHKKECVTFSLCSSFC